MRHRIRRHSISSVAEPRFELVPLLDCVFQLLIFSLYCLVFTVSAKVLPVKLPTLSTGQTPEKVEIAGITINKDGDFFLDRQPITLPDLEARLKELAALPKPPQFFLAVDTEQGTTDRGPLLIDLIEMFRRLKIESFNIIGPAKPQGESANPGDKPPPPDGAKIPQ